MNDVISGRTRSLCNDKVNKLYILKKSIFVNRDLLKRTMMNNE